MHIGKIVKFIAREDSQSFDISVVSAKYAAVT